MTVLSPSALIDKARKKGISLSSLCENAGMPKSTVYRWKNGNNGATLTSLEKLSKQVDTEFSTNIFELDGKNYIYHYGVDGKKGFYSLLE